MKIKREYFKSGNIAFEECYDNNHKLIERSYYYDNSNKDLWMKFPYENGILHGEFISQNSNGSLCSKTLFKKEKNFAIRKGYSSIYKNFVNTLFTIRVSSGNFHGANIFFDIFQPKPKPSFFYILKKRLLFIIECLIKV